jgi:putative hydrolase of the HAD superfamily
MPRHFAAIFDVAAAGFIPKPDPGCYRKMLDALAIAPERAVLFEDTAENLPPAAALGMTTVLVVPPELPRIPDEHIHFVTEDLVAWLRAVTPTADGPAG